MCLDVTAFLERIGHRGRSVPSSQTLCEVHRRHVMTVPFENADVIAGRRLDYRLDRLFDKIVVRRRGGWCLETNWLLAHVLRAMGFAVDFVGAGVATAGNFKNDLSHCLLVVEVDGECLMADVGFGAGSFAEPLPMAPGRYVQQGMAHEVEWRDGYVVVSRLLNGHWVPMYRVLRAPRHIDDFAATTDFNELSRHSLFNKGLTCARFTELGWTLVNDGRLSILTGGRRWSCALSGSVQVDATTQWILHGGVPPTGLPALSPSR
jgi:N-hydroxyarylamine O-acetyltransferase